MEVKEFVCTACPDKTCKWTIASERIEEVLEQLRGCPGFCVTGGRMPEWRER